MHVVVATDEGFAMPAAVTLRSLVAVASEPLHITVLHDSIARDTMRRVVRSLPDGDYSIEWVDAGTFELQATRGTHLTVATYFRLWVADVVPEAAHRVLYIDVDTVVRRDIAPLWDLDLGGRPLAAVQSVHYPFVATRGAVNNWKVLGLDAKTPFFNAGVLLIDLGPWRAKKIAAAAFEYLRSPHLGAGADQEALNVATAGDWFALPSVWNQQTPILSDGFGAHLVFPTPEIEAARADPAIIHYQTRPKPWHRGCTHPWRGEWLRYASLVDFDPVEGLRERSVVAEAQWRAKRAASALLKGR